MLKNITSLRSKMLIALALGMFLLFSLIFFVTRTSLIQGYSKLESDKSMIQVDSAISLIDEYGEKLLSSAKDNAHWDEMYANVTIPNPAFFESIFGEEVFANVGVNAIFIVDNQGQVLFKKSMDYKTGEPWRVTDTLALAVAQDGALINPAKNTMKGLFWTQNGILIVASVDILNSDETKPRLGTMIVVRQIDDDFLDKIEEILGAKINIQAVSDDEISSISPLLKNGKAVKPLNENQVAGYALVNSLGGDSRLLLSAVGDRKIFKLAESSLKLLYWTSAFAALLLIAFSWLFDKLVLKKLAYLNANVIRIGQSVSANGRISEFGGNDEMTSLAHGINNMLEQLDDAKLALQLEKERAEVTLSSIAEAVITSNVNGCVVYMNTAAEHLTGIKISDASGKPLQDLFHLMTADKTTHVNSGWLINSHSIVDEVLLARADGQEFIISKSASPLHDDQNVQFGTVTVLHDVTLLRKMSNQLSHQARFDALTGLANRYEFDRKAQAAIEDARTSSLSHCIAYIDLDKFKLVNDTCGHMTGDVFLKQLANHMQAKLRSADTLARLGGDEFALLLMGCSLDNAQEITRELLETIQAFRFEHNNKVFKVGASIGLTEISPNEMLELSTILATADSACYAAKRQGGNCVYVYQANDNSLKEQHKLLDWVSRINLGLENNQFVLFMQPIAGLKPSREPHCELLIRMKSDDGMLFPPSTFLPAAERYHLMPKIDGWVINEAFSIIARKGTNFKSLCTINLSGQSLSQEGFLEYVLAKIKQYDINTKNICFEITETAVISNLEKAQQFMSELRAIGCRFSLDDFGSGLSSFAYLKNLDVDFLKIDGMFVKSIANNKIDRAMVESINKVGHVMGLHTIAEFAENQEVIDVLIEIGVDYVQGYGVAMPVLFE